MTPQPRPAQRKAILLETGTTIEMVAGWVRTEREARGHGLREASKLTGVPTATLSRFERGEGTVGGEHLLKLLSYLADPERKDVDNSVDKLLETSSQT